MIALESNIGTLPNNMYNNVKKSSATYSQLHLYPIIAICPGNLLLLPPCEFRFYPNKTLSQLQFHFRHELCFK